jgi:hypothetical protein
MRCSLRSRIVDEPTTARRRRVARAPHAADEPAHEHRGARERPRAPRGERERLLDDVVEQLGEMTTLIAELMDLARGEEPQGEPEEIRLDLLTADAVERARRNRPESPSSPSSKSPWCTAYLPRSSAPSPTCSTTPRSGARRTAKSRSPSAMVTSPFATTARGSTRRTCRTSSIASTERPPRVGFPAQARACDRAPGRGCARRHRCRREG